METNWKVDRSTDWLKKLIDLRDGIPFVNEGGLLKKTTKILENVPRFKIERVETGTLHEYDHVCDRITCHLC